MASDKKHVAAKQTAAAKEKDQDQDEQPHALRVDLGESLPTPPIPTATDNE